MAELPLSLSVVSQVIHGSSAYDGLLLCRGLFEPEHDRFPII